MGRYGLREKRHTEREEDIINLLRKDNMGFMEIYKEIDCSEPSLSKHLKKLMNEDRIYKKYDSFKDSVVYCLTSDETTEIWIKEMSKIIGLSIIDDIVYYEKNSIFECDINKIFKKYGDLIAIWKAPILSRDEKLKKIDKLFSDWIKKPTQDIFNESRDW